MNDEVVIKVDNVSKDFIIPHEKSGSVKGIFTSMFRKVSTKKETQHALRDISLEIKKGEFFGIVGRNGSGKSTLLKILAGIYQPTKGQVSTHGKLVPFIELGVGFNAELSGRDNVYLNGAILGFTTKEVEAMYDDIVKFAELERFMDQKLKNYSTGMQVRLAFSMAVRANADILLIDEVLAVGDESFQRKCFRYFKTLKKNNKTVVFVTHEMSAVREFCDRAILIEKNKIEAQGSPDDISNLYSKLFLDEPVSEAMGDESKRWGDGKVTIENVNVHPKLIKDETKNIELSWEVVVNSEIDEPRYGFTIKNAEGDGIVGTNTAISRIKVDPLTAPKTVLVKWKVANVFSDGFYSLAPAIVSKDGTVHDWWEEAATFEVRRLNRNPYPVQPKIIGDIKSE